MRSSESGTMSSAVTGVIERAIRTGIAVFFAEGLRTQSPGAVVNALVAFGGAHLPAILERCRTVELRLWQRIYVETAMLTHAAGMLGPYDESGLSSELTDLRPLFSNALTNYSVSVSNGVPDTEGGPCLDAV
jgi:hypothetical protein